MAVTAILILALSIVVMLGIVGLVLVVFRQLRGAGFFGLSTNPALANAPLAIGTVVSSRRTGLIINNVPQMAVVLDVEPPDGPSFRAEATQLVDVADLAALRPGTTLPVRHLTSPNGTHQVGIASDAPQADVQRVLGLVQLARGEITSGQLMVSENGISARAVVLDMHPTGEIRDGRSVLWLQLQVSPDDSAAFTATVEKAVPAHAVGLVQVGSVVDVRYLPDHPDDLVVALPAN